MANVITAAVGRSHTVLASAARTATPDTQELEVPAGAKFCTLVLDATVDPALASITMKVEGVDRTSGKVWLLLADAAVAAVETSTIAVGPGLPVTANVSANAVLPPVIRVTVTHADADSMTYSVGAHFA